MTPNPEYTLVLQGGGALGSYQAGAYEALHSQGYRPTWVTGTSIGAINAAIIAGNAPEKRVERLREFWEGITYDTPAKSWLELWGPSAQEWFNESSFWTTAITGVPNFFKPRMPPSSMAPKGSVAALSYYDTSPLADTLNRLVDFDLLNARNRGIRCTVSAANVQSGDLVYFDSQDMPANKPINAAHIMASGALPPAFAPIEIEGRFYWDGGIVSNNPLQYVVDHPTGKPMLVVQIDLFSPRGTMPVNISEVNERLKDIQFSSRTRINTEQVAVQKQWASAANRLAKKLHAKLANDPDLLELLAIGKSKTTKAGNDGAVTVLQLIYRSKGSETQSKDAEFSRQTMTERWQAGLVQVNQSLANPKWLNRKTSTNGVAVFDLSDH